MNVQQQVKSAFPAASILRMVFTIFVLSMITITACQLTGQVDLACFTSVHFVFACLLAVVYRIVNTMGWVVVLRGLGRQPRILEAARVWLISESRRWLPGGVWGYASRAVQSKSLGVSVVVASASMLVELLITIAAALFVSMIGLTLYFDRWRATASQLIPANLQSPTAQWLAYGLIVFCLLCYLFRRKLQRKLQLLAEKWQLLRDLNVRGSQLWLAFGYFVLMACLNGAVNLSVLRVCTDADIPALAMISGTAIAWVLGYLAFFSPGGLLVREAALAVLLTPWIPYPTAVTVAVLSRLAQLLAEAACMLLLSLRHSARAGQPNFTGAACDGTPTHQLVEQDSQFRPLPDSESQATTSQAPAWG